MIKRWNIQFLNLTCVICLAIAGCADSDSEDTGSNSAPPVKTATASDEPQVLSARQLRRMLGANEKAKFERFGNDIVEAHLFQSGVKDISALEGLPLRTLDLGACDVTDLSVIKGMPLTTLILEDTPVADIGVVKGMELEGLQLQNTKITDLSMLKGMPIKELNLKSVAIDSLADVADLPLQTLWIPGTNVTDISPLKGKTMVSLDIEDTGVKTLDALADMKTLKRLNIKDTPITDVSPLKGLKLQRITLTPESITTGMEVLRDMPSLTQILTTMEGNPQQAATEFWQKYDAGVWAQKPTEDVKESDNKAKTDSTEPSADESAKAPAKALSRDEKPSKPETVKPEDSAASEKE